MIELLLAASRLPEQPPPVLRLIARDRCAHAGGIGERRHGHRSEPRRRLILCQPAPKAVDARCHVGASRGCRNALARLATALIGTAAAAMPPQLRATLPALPWANLMPAKIATGEMAVIRRIAKPLAIQSALPLFGATPSTAGRSSESPTTNAVA